MRKHFYLLLFVLISAVNAKGAPGDTTWVQANSLQMDYFGDFDTTVTFPDATKTYRKVYMIFTLGKHICPGYDPNNAGDQPGQTGWCGDWDYTVQTFFFAKHASDSVELGRFMTPYAREGYYRFSPTWKQRYIFDISDYYTVLRDTGTVRIHYSGYSGGFTGDVKFAFIEGTPERTVLGVDRLWHGDFNYGHGPVAINTALTTMSKTAPAGTQTAEVKLNLTGHGGDDNGCAEFCPNTYSLSLNNNLLAQQNFYRTDCSSNELYAQTGTWVWARANWCPGAAVRTISHKLTNVSSASTYTLNLSFPAYTSTTTQQNTFPASYTIDAATIYYGGVNKALDASLEDIIAPTDAEYHFRENPTAIAPIVTVRNSGSSAINSIKFEYSVSGSPAPQTYTWTGTLGSLQTMDITFPAMADLKVNPGTYGFNVKILQVNGVADDDATNDELTSTFTGAPNLPAGIIIQMRANNEPDPQNQSLSQTHWRIEDAAGNVVKAKNNCPINTVCTDTAMLNFGEAYRLVVSDSGYFGYYDIPTGNAVGEWHGTGLAGFSSISGWLRMFRLDNHAAITIPGYYNGNFGSGLMMDFYTGFATGITNVNNSNVHLQAYPNPASKRLSVVVDGIDNSAGKITLFDIYGRKLLVQDYNFGIIDVNVEEVPSGVYLLTYTNAANGSIKLQQRIVISK